jgi:hypothetical protein
VRSEEIVPRALEGSERPAEYPSGERLGVVQAAVAELAYREPKRTCDSRLLRFRPGIPRCRTGGRGVP